VVEEECPGCKERAVAYPVAIHLTYLPKAGGRGTAGSPPPPLTPTPNFEQSETSALDLCDDLSMEVMSIKNLYWTGMVITFCFYQLLIGHL
jgi:hypothetical protein